MLLIELAQAWLIFAPMCTVHKQKIPQTLKPRYSKQQQEKNYLKQICSCIAILQE
jgi:hypothetical protein